MALHSYKRIWLQKYDYNQLNIFLGFCRSDVLSRKNHWMTKPEIKMSTRINNRSKVKLHIHFIMLFICFNVDLSNALFPAFLERWWITSSLKWTIHCRRKENMHFSQRPSKTADVFRWRLVTGFAANRYGYFMQKCINYNITKLRK